jgi:hypothetical protein
LNAHGILPDVRFGYRRIFVEVKMFCAGSPGLTVRLEDERSAKVRCGVDEKCPQSNATRRGYSRGERIQRTGGQALLTRPQQNTREKTLGKAGLLARIFRGNTVNSSKPPCNLLDFLLGTSLPKLKMDFLVLYDNQTRSMLQIDQQFPISSQKKVLVVNPDTSVDYTLD